MRKGRHSAYPALDFTAFARKSNAGASQRLRRLGVDNVEILADKSKKMSVLPVPSQRGIRGEGQGKRF